MADEWLTISFRVHDIWIKLYIYTSRRVSRLISLMPTSTFYCYTNHVLIVYVPFQTNFTSLFHPVLVIPKTLISTGRKYTHGNY